MGLIRGNLVESGCYYGCVGVLRWWRRERVLREFYKVGIRARRGSRGELGEAFIRRVRIRAEDLIFVVVTRRGSCTFVLRVISR